MVTCLKVVKLLIKELCKLLDKKIWPLLSDPMSRERYYATTHICSK